MLTTGATDLIDRPHLVGDLVAARSASLGQQARSALATTSVVGSEFGLDVLAFVTGLTVAELLEVVEKCARAQLIEETGPGRFRFTHDLVWETVYSELSASRIAHYHGLIGDAIERQQTSDSELPVLAYHYSGLSMGIERLEASTTRSPLELRHGNALPSRPPFRN